MSNPRGLSDASVIETMQLAYRWGYPMLAMSINNTEFYGSTMNAFYHMKTAANPASQGDRGFNAETLYSAGALDLTDEPMVLTVPPIGDRFYVIPVQDAWGNIDDVIGTRTEGNGGGNYLICGPNWTGDAPDGMKQFRLHTNVGFLPGRSMVTGPKDALAFATTVQDHFSLTPLSRWGTGAANPNRDSLVDPLPIDPARNYNHLLLEMSTQEYFTKLNELLVKNPPYDYDAPVLERFAELGIGPGLTFDVEAFTPAVRDAMAEFGRTDPIETGQKFADTGIDHELRALTSRFGTRYYERYLMLFGGLGGNLLEDGMYVWLSADTDGAKLDGSHRYLVHFDPSQVPHTRAFWSLTLYTRDFYLAKDVPMDRHMLNSSSGMRFGADGSLDIFLQSDSPGPEHEDNWLPTPSDEYIVILRIYWPEGDLLTDSWSQPVPQRR